ncbi:MAG: CpsD/CapB family tyrosine-protein kinase [Chloroflexi bacterium]|nr:CpsD/CapB family tyrosine-protein kinase [Chloroflexota bacterium]
MALANVAEFFYQGGLKVLIVDWDLESPGLERFFDLPLDITKNPGVIDLLMDYKKQMSDGISDVQSLEELPFSKPEAFAINVYPEKSDSKGQLHILLAGKRYGKEFPEYVENVHAFDWQNFYKDWVGESYFFWLREQFLAMADVVLIDSRTGITEMGGVCTYQLADTVVMFCAPNQQNIEGTRTMVANFTHDSVTEKRSGHRLDVLIVPSRIERAESGLLDNFQTEFKNIFQKFAQPSNGKDIQSFWDLNIPYIPKYAYKERIALREEIGKASAIDMQLAFMKLSFMMMELKWGKNTPNYNEHLKNFPQIPQPPEVQTPVDHDEQSFLNSAQRYGLGYNSVSVRCIINPDGSAKIIRKIEATAFSKFARLDTYLLITGKSNDMEIGTIQSLTPGRTIIIGDVKEELGRLSAELSFDPPLIEKETITYAMEEELVSSGLFAIGLSENEMSKRTTPYDFFNWNINRPTQKLTLEVCFPKYVKPYVYGAEVRYASASGFPSSRLHDVELKHLSRPTWDKTSEDQNILRLDVKYPMIGLIYGLRWQPLISGEVLG